VKLKALLLLVPNLQFGTSGFSYPHLPLNIFGQLVHYLNICFIPTFC